VSAVLRPIVERVESIGSYAIIGDCRAAALLSRHGSIDWLCWPRFDSPPLFCDLLGGGGSFQLTPVGRFSSERHYVPSTNVLQTRFTTGGGSVLTTDLMPVASEWEKRHLLLADHEILRRVECLAGEVELRMHLDARAEWGKRRVQLLARGPLGFRGEVSGALLTFRSEVPCRRDDDGALEARFRLRAGEVVRFSLSLAVDEPAVLSPLGHTADESISRSVAWWRKWASQLQYGGAHREAVERSALALRLLVYAPSGAVVAAPTTSLPERLGGDLNWDYRYCWLRDASLTVRALYGLGYDEEATSFVSWLLHTTRLTRPRLRILYDVHGGEPPKECVLPLPGHAHSRPVRLGNAAKDQLQLDVYGEVIDATAQAWRRGARKLDRETRRMLVSFGKYVCQNWSNPDEGIWEPRSGRARHTHSHLLCWVALDRLLELHQSGYLPELEPQPFSLERERIGRAIRERAWSSRKNSYVATLDGETLDASLLLLPWYGFEDARSPRVRATYDAVCRELRARDALYYRYRSGESSGEGAFVVCGFWATELLALGGGSLDEAEASLEAQLRYRNDVGLFAEEIDAESAAQLGNFPQGFSHIGLINAALTVERRRQEERQREREAVVRPAELVETRS
jgi:GH15 family glucan-1,4-alpha-glucosidase